METKELETLLATEIQEDLENLRDLELGSEEYKVAVDGIVKLMDRAIDLRKVDVDAEDKLARLDVERESNEVKQAELKLKEEQFNVEIELKQKQLDSEKKDQLFRNGIAIAGIVIPSVITIWGTVKSLKFEETGTVTTLMGRGFINKLLPKK